MHFLRVISLVAMLFLAAFFYLLATLFIALLSGVTLLSQGVRRHYRAEEDSP